MTDHDARPDPPSHGESLLSMAACRVALATSQRLASLDTTTGVGPSRPMGKPGLRVSPQRAGSRTLHGPERIGHEEQLQRPR